MKTINSLFVALFAILLIASCDNSTTADTKEGQRIGTWMVYDTEAEWIGTGSQSKAKGLTTQAAGDTTHYTEPDGFSITLYQDNAQPDELAFFYYDSTMTEDQGQNASIEIGSSSGRFDTPGIALGRTGDNIFFVTSYFEKICNDSTVVPSDEMLYLSVVTRDNSEADFEKTISLDIAGMDSVFQELAQCN